MANTYTLIASNTLSSSAASVTFSSIPNTYTDLVLKISARNDNAAVGTRLQMRINGNSGNIYSTTYIYGDGTNAVSGRTTSLSFVSDGIRQNSANSTANTFSNIELYLPSYTSANNKVMSSNNAVEDNQANNFLNAFNASVLMQDTNAITSILLYNNSTQQFVSGSSFFLYGIKNS